MKKRARQVSFLKSLSKKWNRLSATAKLTGIALLLIFVAVITLAANVQRARIAEVGMPATPTTTSPFQYALQLDGSGYVTVNDSVSINPNINSGFTAEAWIKPSEAIYGAMRIIDKTNGSKNSFSLWTDAGYNSGEGRYYVNYYFYVANSGCLTPYTIFNQQTYSDPAAVTAWHHVAGVVQAGGKLDIFVDGKASVNNFNAVSSTCADTGIPIQIGARVKGSEDVDGHFRGEIDEAHVTNVALYQSDFSRPNNPTLARGTSTVFLFHMDNDFRDSVYSNKYGIGNGSYSFVPSTIPYLTSPVVRPSPSVYSSPVASYPSKPSPSPYMSPALSPRPSAYASPKPSCVPAPSCAPGQPCAMPLLAEGWTYCPVRPSPIASSTSFCRPRIASLSMSGRCSTNGFTAFSYQCVGGTLIKSSGTCLDASAIYKKVSTECGSVCAETQPRETPLKY